MNGKIEKLGKWAEKQFSALCSAGNVIVNKSDEDETGWDFLMEFPPVFNLNLPPDLQEIERTARVQVKSITGRKLIAKLKLSNAHRFAANTEPCFIILVCSENGGNPVKFYAKHFWKDEISKTLKRLRQAESKSRGINKQTIEFRFKEEDDHTFDIIDWIKHEIENFGDNYRSEKLKIYNTSGYEDGSLFGTLTFAVDEIENIVNHSIGLDATVHLANARLVDRRFGIDARTPVFDSKPARIEMRSRPEPCVVEIADADDQIIRITGELFLPGIPGLPASLTRVQTQLSS